jgi:hypothetical protein
LAAALAVAALSACGTPADRERQARERAKIEAAEEKAAVRLFRVPYSLVWSSLLDAARQRGLAVVAADAGSGVAEFSHGVSLTSLGERVQARVGETAEGLVRVEIRSRALTAFAVPRDWQRILFGDLEQAFAPRPR